MKKKASTISSEPKKRKVSPAGARQKGLQFERYIANRLGHIFPEAERNLEFQASAAQEGQDIKGTDRIKIQAKCHQNYVSIGTIREIQVRYESDIPVLVTKGNRMDAMAVLPFEKLVTLLEIAYGLSLPFRKIESLNGAELLEEARKVVTSTYLSEGEAALVLPDGNKKLIAAEDIVNADMIVPDYVAIEVPEQNIDDLI
jgi:hypothetical protein